MDRQMIPTTPSDDPLDDESAALLDGLRRALRRAGWTQANLAEEIGVGTATIKRWLHGRGLGFTTLARLTALAGTSLAELAQDGRRNARDRNHLTLAQEEALTQDASLSTIFILIVNGWPPSEAVEAFHIPSDVVENAIIKLERLALIDRLSGGRIRARLDPTYSWQRAPMRQHFERNLKQLFFSLDYGDPDTIFGSEMVKLSPIGIARIRDRIEQLRGELRAISREDQRNAALPGEWFAVLAVARSLKPLI
jgi:transcriptional regulator with XRE-family HTH domain